MTVTPSKFPISRDPPEGGTQPKEHSKHGSINWIARFQFLGIPPKGELPGKVHYEPPRLVVKFPISRDPPEGGTFPADVAIPDV